MKVKKTMRIYQAGPLVSETEQNWRRAFRARLVDAGHAVVWPGDLIRPEDVKTWGADAPKRIMEIDWNALNS